MARLLVYFRDHQVVALAALDQQCSHTLISMPGRVQSARRRTVKHRYRRRSELYFPPASNCQPGVLGNSRSVHDAVMDAAAGLPGVVVGEELRGSVHLPVESLSRGCWPCLSTLESSRG